jgi:SAM-dependent methyltransferase
MYVVAGRRAWETDELRWGLWGKPESALRLLDGFGAGEDAVELGCGTAATSSWLLRRGMRPVAIDFSRAQLRNAETLQHDFNLTFPLVCSNVEQVAFDNDSFDLAVSEYGASVWCDPVRWLPEARRLLRSNGRLIFFAPAPMMLACTPPDGGEPGPQLRSDYFSLRYMEFGPDAGIEFQLTYSGWARLLCDTGFVIEDILETRPSPGARPRHPLVSNEWARRWPTEVIWIARATEPLPRPDDDLLGA